MFLKKRISKIIPSFLVDKASCTRQFESELSLHSLASLFPIKEGSTFLTKPLFPQEREDVTALRCSEPLRYKVGGPSKVCAMFAGWDRLEMEGVANQMRLCRQILPKLIITEVLRFLFTLNRFIPPS